MERARPFAKAFDAEDALLGCARGDVEALRRLYENMAPLMMGVALRIVGRRDLAHDVLHDAFILIWRRADTFDPARGSARVWLISVVRHRALSVLRQRGREQPLDEDRLAEQPVDEPSALDRLAFAADASALRRCLGELDDGRRMTIALAYVDGLSYPQIAAKLGAPVGTVKSWARRGLEALRRCLT